MIISLLNKFNNKQNRSINENILHLIHDNYKFIFIGCGSRSGPDLYPEASRKTVRNLPDRYINTPLPSENRIQPIYKINILKNIAHLWHTFNMSPREIVYC